MNLFESLQLLKEVDEKSIDYNKLETDVDKIFNNWAKESVDKCNSGEVNISDVKYSYNGDAVTTEFANILFSFHKNENKYYKKVVDDLVKKDYDLVNLWDETNKKCIQKVHTIINFVAEKHYKLLSKYNPNASEELSDVIKNILKKEQSKDVTLFKHKLKICQHIEKYCTDKKVIKENPKDAKWAQELITSITTKYKDYTNKEQIYKVINKVINKYWSSELNTVKVDKSKVVIKSKSDDKLRTSRRRGRR